MSPDRSAPARPAPGTPLQFRWRKWDGGEHWVHDCLYLGRDSWGDWVGQPVGYASARPGRAFAAPSANVTLVPASGDYAFTANSHPPGHYRVYIDIAWDVRWSGVDVLEGIDMDLDVVLAFDDRGLWIDDRDEWDEHRVRYGYPLDLVDRLEALAVDLERRVAASEPPFDDATTGVWFQRLTALTPAPRNRTGERDTGPS